MDLSERIRRHFDEVGEREWERLDASPRTRVSLEVHRRFLRDHISPGDRVLEIGAGPGRFTIALAELGARVVVTDVSPVQLDLNRQHVAEHGAFEAVEDRYLLDIMDSTRFAEDEFDAVVAFGGPLSYVFDGAERALAGLLRIGRVVVASLMSTLGSWSFFLPQITAEVPLLGAAADNAIFGDRRPATRGTGRGPYLPDVPLARGRGLGKWCRRHIACGQRQQLGIAHA